MTAPIEAPTTVSQPRRADVCIMAIAELFRGDGEILANPIGDLPRLGGHLARATFEPDLLMTDGEAMLISRDGEIEGWNPYRKMFDLLWGGHRHVVMGASQIDQFGNQNIAYIGQDPSRPTRQLIGFRGAPGNTVSHVTSYWVPNHSPRVFVERVDVVSGVGYDSAKGIGGVAARRHEIRRVVSNLAVLDFETRDHRMRLASVHPGVDVGEVLAATGFDLALPEGDVPTTAWPDHDSIAVIDRFDPDRKRYAELRDA